MTEQNTAQNINSIRLWMVWVFFGLSAALSWTVWLWPISHRAVFFIAYEGWRITWPTDNMKLVIGNALPGLLALVWVSVQGKERLHDLLSSVFAWRTSPIWYLLSIALPSIVLVISACAVLILFSQSPGRPSMLVLVNSLLTLPTGPLCEEIAWRGFALRKLRLHYSPLLSALIIGVYWAVWHIPVWLLTLKYLTITLLLVICINLVAWSVVFAFLYERSGESLPVVILLHATYQAVQAQVAVVVTRGTVSIILIAAALSVFLAVILGRRLERQPPAIIDSNAQPS